MGIYQANVDFNADGLQIRKGYTVEDDSDLYLRFPANFTEIGPYESQLTTGLNSARPAAATFGKGYYFATDTGQLSHSNGTAWTSLGPSSANTALITDLFCDSWVTMGAAALLSTVNATSSPLFTAPIPMTIKQVAFLSWATDVTVSDASYWTMTLRRYRAGAVTQIAVKNTTSSSGSAWTARIPWNFDAITLDATGQQFQQYDVFGVFVQKTGTPADPAGVRCMVRWEPA